MKLPDVLSAACIAMTAAAVAFAEPQKVEADKVPPAVWKSLQIQSKGKQPSSIERDQADGAVTYAAIFAAGTAQESSITVAEDGTLLGAELPLAETPVAVQKTITTQLAGSTLDSIEKNLEEGAPSYDVDFTTKDGKERSLSLAEDGSLLSIEVGLEETPPAVQQAIKAQTGEGKLGEIDKNADGAVATYDVESTTKEGKSRNFTLNADGSLESVEIMLAEATEAAQKTIRNQIGAGRLIRVAETFRNQKLMGYDVDGMVAGKSISFHVGLRGKFLGMLE